MIEKSAKRKIIASLHALALIMLALIAALSSQFSSIAWFSTNDTVSADGISVSSVRAGLFEEIHFYRGTHTHLLQTVTVGEDCYLYIFVDYHLPAVEDVVEKTLLYVEKAQAANPSYSDIIVGHTNLVFKTDFEFVVEEAAQ